MSSVIVALKEKKQVIADLQSEKSRLEGRKEQLLKDLKEKHNINNINDAEKKLDELEKERVKKEKALEAVEAKLTSIIKSATKKGTDL